MKRFLLAVAAVLALSAVQPAVAQPMPIFNWSGFYIGGHVGGAWSKTDWTSITGVTVDLSQQASAFLGGGQIGLQGQFGNVVTGVEVSYSGTSLSRTTLLFAVENYTSVIDRMLLVTGRLGLASDRSLFYVKGGWASGHSKFEIFHVGAGVHANSSLWGNGWTVGAGWEYAFGPNLSAGLEYNFVHINIGNHAQTVGPQGCSAPCSVNNAKSDIHSVWLRANYRFAWAP